MEHLSYEERLREFGLFNLKEDKTPRTTYSSLPVSEEGLQESWRGTLYRTYSDRTREHGFKLKEGGFRLDMRKELLKMKVMRHWNRLPREVVAAPSLKVFKARLDGALSKVEAFLSMAANSELDDL